MPRARCLIPGSRDGAPWMTRCGREGERAPAQCRRRPRQREAALSWKLAMVFSVQRHTSAVWRVPRPISRVVAWWCDGAAVPASAFRRSREGRGEADR